MAQIQVRYVCTKGQPWEEGKGRSIHPEAELFRQVHDNTAIHNDYDVYKCPHCELEFEVTVPN